MATPVRGIVLVVKDDDSQTVENPLLLFHPNSSDYTLTNATVAMTVESFSNGKFTGALYCYVDRFGGDTYLELDAQDITSINFPALASMEDATEITFHGNPLLASVNFESLSEIAINATLVIDSCALLASASFPRLAVFEGALALKNNNSLALVSLPVLISAGTLQLYGLASMQSISLPALASINRFQFNDSPALLSVSLPSLTTLEANSLFYGYGNVLLASVSIPSLASVGDGAQIDINTCALTQNCVNDLLVKINAAKQGTGRLDFSGGTSVAPSGAGATAKAALITAGWTVTTN